MLGMTRRDEKGDRDKRTADETSVGIVYHPEDTHVAQRIVMHLEDNNPNCFRCFFAERASDLKPGQMYLDFLNKMIEQCSKFVVIVSDNFLSCRECRLDMNTVLHQFRKYCNVYIAFVKIGDVKLPYSILKIEDQYRKWISWNVSDQQSQCLRDIAKSLRGSLVSAQSFPITRYKYSFGEDNIPDQSCIVHSEVQTLNIQHKVVRVPNACSIIITEGLHITFNEGKFGVYVIQTTQLTEDIQDQLKKLYTHFAPLISKVMPCFIVSIQSSSLSDTEGIDALIRLQSWERKNLDHYKILYSESTALTGDDWIDISGQCSFACNLGKIGCFQFEASKCGNYMLCNSKAWEPETMLCVIKALAHFMETSYIRLVCMVDYETGKITLAALRLKSENIIKMLTSGGCFSDITMKCGNEITCFYVTFNMKVNDLQIKMPAVLDLRKAGQSIKTLEAKERITSCDGKISIFQDERRTQILGELKLPSKQKLDEMERCHSNTLPLLNLPIDSKCEDREIISGKNVSPKSDYSDVAEEYMKETRKRSKSEPDMKFQLQSTSVPPHTARQCGEGKAKWRALMHQIEGRDPLTTWLKRQKSNKF